MLHMPNVNEEKAIKLHLQSLASRGQATAINCHTGAPLV